MSQSHLTSQWQSKAMWALKGTGQQLSRLSQVSQSQPKLTPLDAEFSLRGDWSLWCNPSGCDDGRGAAEGRLRWGENGQRKVEEDNKDKVKEWANEKTEKRWGKEKSQVVIGREVGKGGVEIEWGLIEE